MLIKFSTFLDVLVPIVVSFMWGLFLLLLFLHNKLPENGRVPLQSFMNQNYLKEDSK